MQQSQLTMTVLCVPHVLKILYAQFTRLPWWWLLAGFSLHYLASAKLMAVFESGESGEWVAFFIATSPRRQPQSVTNPMMTI